MSTFDYYYGDESSQFSFCRVPRPLVTGKMFSGLSSDAKLLYALMLERMGLSARNGWYDEQGRVFIYYTVNEVRTVLNCGNDKAIKLLAELDTLKGIGLIERVKQGQGRPTKIFVKNFSREIVSQDDIPTSIQEDEPSSTRTQDCEKPAVLTSENQQSRLLKTRNQDIGKAECNYIDMNYIYISYINPSIYQQQCAVWADSKDAPVHKAVYKQNAPKQELFRAKPGSVHREADSGAFGVAVTASTAFDSTNARLLGAKPLRPRVECHPLRQKRNPPSVPRQGRAVAFATAREPASLRTGRALTGAARRIFMWRRGRHPKSRQRAAAFSMWASHGTGYLPAQILSKMCLKLRYDKADHEKTAIPS